jgi:general stress protein YciG
MENQRDPKTANRGFASMDPEQQRAIARKGGLTVSRNREHMAQIGRKGGEASGAKKRKTNNGDVEQTSKD